MLAGEDAERARGVAREVAGRLTSPDMGARLEAGRNALAAAGAQARGWWRPGLGGGACSVALLCAQLDRAEPGAGWDRRGHAALSSAADAAGRDGTPLGLFEGLAGLGFSACRLAAGRNRYGALLRSVDDVLTSVLGARCAELRRAHGLPVHEWDLVSGVTGIGAHLLGRRDEPEARVALEALGRSSRSARTTRAVRAGAPPPSICTGTCVKPRPPATSTAAWHTAFPERWRSWRCRRPPASRCPGRRRR